MKIKQPSRYLSRRSFLGKAAAALAVLGTGGKLFAQTTAPIWNADMELGIKFEIIATNSGRYKKPYVAVWIEDAAGNAVRTLALWMLPGKGSRWLPELTRWYRDERARSQADGGDMAATLASPTRSPGTYKVTWDGLNDAQVLVAQGEYFVCVETAREHGAYQLAREKFNFGNEGFSAVIPGETELGEVSVEYYQRA